MVVEFENEEKSKGHIVGMKETKDKLIFDQAVREEYRCSVMGGSASGATPTDKDNFDNAQGDSEGDDQDEAQSSSSYRKCFSCCGRRSRDDDTETSCQESIIIHQEGNFYRIWELIVILSCIISSYAYMYLAAFGEPTPNSFLYILDYIFLGIFGIDIIIQFLLDYKPEDSYVRVRELILIAKKYLHTQFLFDFIPMIPFHLFTDHPQRKLFFMIKVIRIQKGRSLFSSNSFMRFVKDMF